MNKTTTQVYCKAVNDGSGVDASVYEVASDGYIPALCIEHDTGEKYLFIIVCASICNFETQAIKFTVKQRVYDPIFNVWAELNTKKLTNSELSILNSFQVDLATGKWKEEMTAEELAEATLVGEYDRWFGYLKQMLIVPLLNALDKKINYVAPSPTIP